MPETYGAGKFGDDTYGGVTVVPGEIDLHVKSKTATIVTVAWTPHPDATGYLLKKNGVIVSQGTNPAQATARFSAKTGDVLEVIPTLPGDKIRV